MGFAKFVKAAISDTMCARGLKSGTVTKIVTKTGAKQAKINELQDSEIIVILRLAK